MRSVPSLRSCEKDLKRRSICRPKRLGLAILFFFLTQFARCRKIVRTSCKLSCENPILLWVSIAVLSCFMLLLANPIYSAMVQHSPPDSSCNSRLKWRLRHITIFRIPGNQCCCCPCCCCSNGVEVDTGQP